VRKRGGIRCVLLMEQLTGLKRGREEWHTMHIGFARAVISMAFSCAGGEERGCCDCGLRSCEGV